MKISLYQSIFVQRKQKKKYTKDFGTCNWFQSANFFRRRSAQTYSHFFAAAVDVG
jgi:hypothetical protein